LIFVREGPVTDVVRFQTLAILHKNHIDVTGQFGLLQQEPHFDFTKYLRTQLKDKIQSAFLFKQLVDNHLRINVTSRLFVKKANPSDGLAQARNQLGTPGGKEIFERGPNFSNYVQ